jgi:hypothetical protein
MEVLSSARRRYPKKMNQAQALVSKENDLNPCPECWQVNATLSNFEHTTTTSEEKDSDWPQKRRKVVSTQTLLMIWFQQRSKYLSWLCSVSVIFFIYILVIQKGAIPFQQPTQNGRTTNVRSHIISYYDAQSNTYIKRSINIDLPQLLQPLPIPKWKSIEREPWFDFQDPDDGVAFSMDEQDSIRQCFPMAEWQTSNYQTCNRFHELETHSSHSLKMQYINCGENRCTFLFHDGQDTLVLKTLKLGHVSNAFDSYFGGPSRYRMAIKDSLALSKLSSSSFVVNIYGSCALAQLVEHSSGGNIHDLLKRSRRFRNFHVGPSPDDVDEHHSHEHDPNFRLISPFDRVKIAYHVATAVADMHSLEEHPYGLPSMAHNDLCCHQFMLIDGIYKLGDFDWATMLTQTKPLKSLRESKALRGQDGPPKMCQTTPLQMSIDYLKSLTPEELWYYEEMKEALEDQGWKGKIQSPSPVYRDKLDVYQIGTIMYYLVTNRWVWEGHSTYEAIFAVTHVGTYRTF